MILHELNERLYLAISQFEFMLLRFYKVDPYTLLSNLTVIDMQSLIQRIEYQNKKDQEDKQGDTLSKALVALRDILNYMTMPVR